MSSKWNFGIPIPLSECLKCEGTGKVMDQEKVGRALRNIRIRSGKTILEVASEMGISDTLLSLMEHGKRSWNRERIVQHLQICKSKTGAK